MAVQIAQEAKQEAAMSISLLRVGVFLVAKYYAFFIVLAFVNDGFQTSVLANSRGTGEVLSSAFYYFIYISWAVLLLGLVLVLPFYFVLKIRRKAVLILCLIVLLLVEFGLYTWAASPLDFWNGFYNGLVTMLFIPLFFKSVFMNLVKR